MPNVDLSMRMTPVRIYKALKSWDLFPVINGTSGLVNDLNAQLAMPATCNRTRVYLGCVVLSAPASYNQAPGILNLILTGYNATDEKMVEIPVGVHTFQVPSNSVAAKFLSLPTGFSERRLVNRYTASSANPQVYTESPLNYGWTARGGEAANIDVIVSASGNAGISDARDNLVLSGTVAETTPANAGFAVTVAPWLVESPIARWQLIGEWSGTGLGSQFGFSDQNTWAFICGLFVGEQT